MRRMITRLAVFVACSAMAAIGCGNKESGGPTTNAEATTAEPTATAAETAAPAPTDTAAAAPADTGSAATTEAAASPSGAAVAPAAKGAATAAPSGSAAAGAKTFDCGAKGQKLCPMQGWMKGVMASAASSGDGAKLASALAYAAGKAPPGMGSWSSIANEGAAKAKAGDIDGAKASCKKCHSLYKKTYKTTMRDRPW